MDNFLDTLKGDSPSLQLIGKWGYKIYKERELVLMYIHLIIAALFPIYTGSHASLRRPPSAQIPERSSETENYEDDDDEIEVQTPMEGLTPSDAIMLPIFAGITLSFLYLVIKWLKDPALLNKILGWYFSTLGVVGVGKLLADGMNVGITFIFPLVWSTRRETFHVDPLLREQTSGAVSPTRTLAHQKSTGKTNPFPGLFSRIQFPKAINETLWDLRSLLTDHWIFKAYFHGLLSLKTKVRFNDVLGYLLGLVAIIAYNFSGKAWFFTNLMGFGFSYGALTLMSPTTFWTGSLVLAGLFFYDITMVFYTPLMITVATSLDVPIKLVFPGPGHDSMLGLGDVVLPGIVMALALRFDLHLYYLKKQRYLTEASSPGSSSAEPQLIKAPYKEATGNWGELFWTRRFRGTSNENPTVADNARFPKVYFTASIIGYVIGMLATLIALSIYKHGQPALLYLVPGVLISLWGTALIRGEVNEMWRYTEDGGIGENREKKLEKSTKENGTAKFERKEKADTAHPVFVFALYASKKSTLQLKKANAIEE
ncbi:hypothetical protein B7494_g6127 [Chlorociboria aeruginascens]|nr:hypothetical protein B7494_g6127 [Chlorociboria aeruginascens]